MSRVRRKQTEPSWPQCLLTDVKTTTYQIVAGDLVVADLSTGPFTLTAPASPQHNQIFGVRNVGDFNGNFILVDSGDATFIESAFLPVALSAVQLYTEGATIYWQYDAPSSTWAVIAGARLGQYAEAYLPSGLPQNIEGTGIVIQWTFQPVFPGQTQLMFSEAAGVFTHNFDDVPIEVAMDLEIEYVFSSPNEFADTSISLVHTGTPNLAVFPRISQGYPTSRAAINYWSSGSSGAVEASAVGETFSFQSTAAISGGGSSISINSGLLTFLVG